MMKPYFVMLNCDRDGEKLTPIQDMEGFVARFSSEIEAIEEALKTESGQEYGFEIFEIGNGVDYYERR